MLKVSFYSYKGGSGRSTTAWNTIQQLAEIMKPTKEHPFVIVDADTQSAGATFLFGAEEEFTSEDQYLSVQKRMIDEPGNYGGGTDLDAKKTFFGTMWPIGGFFGKAASDNESVLLIGANVDKDSVSASNAAADGKNEKIARSQMENFRKGITVACRRYGAKALFFDTPSGSQFLARMSVQQSDVVVCCMRPTRQFRTGTFGQLKQFLEWDAANDKQRKYIITPTAVCVDKEQKIDSKEYPQTGYDEIKKQFAAEKLKKYGLEKAFEDSIVFDMLELESQADCENSVEKIFGIPEVKRFKWFEECLGELPEEERSKNDNMAIKRYNLLARTIMKFCNEEKDE
jgi:cellulose biosynthesis protein BcsQ